MTKDVALSSCIVNVLKANQNQCLLVRQYSAQCILVLFRFACIITFSCDFVSPQIACATKLWAPSQAFFSSRMWIHDDYIPSWYTVSVRSLYYDSNTSATSPVKGNFWDYSLNYLLQSNDCTDNNYSDVMLLNYSDMTGGMMACCFLQMKQHMRTLSTKRQFIKG